MLEDLWKKGTDFLGCKYSILGGAMSWISESKLVAAISNSGAFGMIACGSMNAKLLSEEIKKTKELTDKNFGVNLIVMHPELSELIQTCIDNNVTHVALAGGIPKSISISQLKSAGVKVLAFAPALIIAKKLIKMGIDAIIIEGMEAGGHIGPVSTSVLAQEILPYVKEVPVFVAGGIARGDMISTYLMQGAAGCQLGTIFVCTSESIAHPNFKAAFIKANARDAIASVQIDPEFPVIPVRAISNKATDEFAKAQREAIDNYKSGRLTKEQAQLDIEHFWAGALRRAVIDGDTESGSIMAGQSVGMVNSYNSTQEIIDELVNQANMYFNQH